MKKRFGFILLLAVYFFFTKSVLAITNPLQVANNRFGIHIVDENDLVDAAILVNSSGGDWGYVKLVIREDDRNKEKWQNVFNQMRKLHLIPVVRLATRMEKSGWAKPRVNDIGSWIDFLSSLNWVIKNRYVIIFNEPNHAKEWGGEINPEEYSWYLKEFSSRLKEKSADFFILPAGLDASAPTSSETLDEAEFIKRMLAKEPDVYNFIDGWSSHSYPNPGFSGSPYTYGRGTINNYLWEMDYLKNLGVQQNLPVFITETGWRHNSGKNMEYGFPNPEVVAQNYLNAFTNVWQNPQLVAVIPFLLNYQDYPFDHFSFRKINSTEFYPAYSVIQQIAKNKGKPKQENSVKIASFTFPNKLVVNSNYNFDITLENTGQSLLGKAEGWQISFADLPLTFSIKSDEINLIEPGQQTKINLQVKTPQEAGIYKYRLVISRDEEKILEENLQLTIVVPPSLILHAKTWIANLAGGNDFKILIYDNKEKLLYEKKNLVFDKGTAEVKDLYNIIPNQKYRLVLVKDYYLPRQTYAAITETTTPVKFSWLIPFDFSNDGKFSFSDIKEVIKHPWRALRLFMAL